jgi:hypothetical protein
MLVRCPGSGHGGSATAVHEVFQGIAAAGSRRDEQGPDRVTRWPSDPSSALGVRLASRGAEQAPAERWCRFAGSPEEEAMEALVARPLLLVGVVVVVAGVGGVAVKALGVELGEATSGRPGAIAAVGLVTMAGGRRAAESEEL